MSSEDGGPGNPGYPTENKKRRAPRVNEEPFKKSDSVLLSHRVTPAVPSALEGLTSVFGMGTGVALPELPPEKNYEVRFEITSAVA